LSNRRHVDEENVGPETPLLGGQAKKMALDHPSLKSLLANPRVRTAILNYSILSLLDIAYVVLQPLVLATPVSAGGLGLSPPQIGLIMGLFGFIDGTIEIICFPALCRRLGTKRVFILGIGSFWIAIAAFPLMNFLVKRNGLGLGVYLVMVLQLMVIILDGMAFG
jgi:Na+/melibiose symporter-like transporter